MQGRLGQGGRTAQWDRAQSGAGGRKREWIDSGDYYTGGGVHAEERQQRQEQQRQQQQQQLGDDWKQQPSDDQQLTAGLRVARHFSEVSSLLAGHLLGVRGGHISSSSSSSGSGSSSSSGSSGDSGDAGARLSSVPPHADAGPSGRSINNTHINAAFGRLAVLHRGGRANVGGGYRTRQLYELLEWLGAAALPRAPRMRPREASGVLWACAALDFPPTPDLLDALYGRMLQTRPLWSSLDVANSVWALPLLLPELTRSGVGGHSGGSGGPDRVESVPSPPGRSFGPGTGHGPSGGARAYSWRAVQMARKDAVRAALAVADLEAAAAEAAAAAAEELERAERKRAQRLRRAAVQYARRGAWAAVAAGQRADAAGGAAAVEEAGQEDEEDEEGEGGEHVSDAGAHAMDEALDRELAVLEAEEEEQRRASGAEAWVLGSGEEGGGDGDDRAAEEGKQPWRDGVGTWSESGEEGGAGGDARAAWREEQRGRENDFRAAPSAPSASFPAAPAPAASARAEGGGGGRRRRKKPGARSPQRRQEQLQQLASPALTDRPSWLRPFVAASLASLLEMPARPLVVTANSLSRLEPAAVGAGGLAPEQVVRIAELLGDVALKMGPQDVANALCAIARLRVRPQPQVMALLVSRIADQLPSFKGEELTLAMYGLAKLKYRPPVQLLIALYKATATRLPGVPSACLPLLLWSAGELGVAGAPREWVCAVLDEIGERAEEMGGQQIAITLYSLACLQFTLDPPAARMLAQRVRALLRTHMVTRHQQLSMVCWGTARLQLTLGAACKVSLLWACREALPGFSDQGFSNMLWGIVRACAGKPTRSWVAAAGEEARQRMHRMGAIDLPQVAWALAKLGYEPDVAWKQALLSRLSRLQLQLAPEGLTAALHACARLGALPSKLVS
ncbi:hypothetical protein FOA52_014176 [Chlamydomonas sp. UWO 241]|nr:hypothetical protein FOA52_014176 [Chlamydomonas sp. UWO 241]